MDDDELHAVVSLLGDECARRILVMTAEEPVAADVLVERCDASRATVYRRLAALTEHALLTEQTRPAPNGHHYEVYAAALDGIALDLTADGFDLRVQRRERMSDRLTEFIEGL